VERRRAAVPAVHMLLAGTVALLAMLGLLGTGSAGDDTTAASTVVDTVRFAFFVVLPQSGIVALGLFDWQMGRGPNLLRAADVAVFALGCLELSIGAVGFTRFLAGAISVLAAAGLAASILVVPPRRAGWRH
jgi:hypothetical protein